MRPDAVLLDYDRTLTFAERLTPVPDALAALAAARRAGTRVVVVSGRTLTELESLLGALPDAIVAENGARLRLRDGPLVELAPALPTIDPGVPLDRGVVIASVDVAHEGQLRATLDAAGIRATYIRNRDRVMALPPGIDKASGALHALRLLGVDPARAVAFGDGENDVALLGVVGHGVAVANAVAELKETADEVAAEEGGAAIAAWIRAHLEVVA